MWVKVYAPRDVPCGFWCWQSVCKPLLDGLARMPGTDMTDAAAWDRAAAICWRHEGCEVSYRATYALRNARYVYIAWSYSVRGLEKRIGIASQGSSWSPILLSMSVPDIA